MRTEMSMCSPSSHHKGNSESEWCIDPSKHALIVPYFNCQDSPNDHNVVTCRSAVMPQQYGAEQGLIGIAGMHGRLPSDSSSHSAHDPICKVPLDRWDTESHNITVAAGARFGSFVADWASFDAVAFGISPSEAAVMEPQQRLLLEVCLIWVVVHLYVIGTRTCRPCRPEGQKKQAVKQAATRKTCSPAT